MIQRATDHKIIDMYLQNTPVSQPAWPEEPVIRSSGSVSIERCGSVEATMPCAKHGLLMYDCCCRTCNREMKDGCDDGGGGDDACS